jgi:hypothetical protein
MALRAVRGGMAIPATLFSSHLHRKRVCVEPGAKRSRPVVDPGCQRDGAAGRQRRTGRRLLGRYHVIPFPGQEEALRLRYGKRRVTFSARSHGQFLPSHHHVHPSQRKLSPAPIQVRIGHPRHRRQFPGWRRWRFAVSEPGDELAAGKGCDGREKRHCRQKPADPAPHSHLAPHHAFHISATARRGEPRVRNSVNFRPPAQQQVNATTVRPRAAQ